MATMRVTKMKGPSVPKVSSPGPARLHEWGDMIWVKSAHPLAQFAQDIRDGNGVVIRQEHVRAVTDPETGLQHPIPMLVTFTRQLEQALTERPLGAAVTVAPILECTADEIALAVASSQVGSFLAGAAFVAGDVATAPGGQLGSRESHVSR